MSRYEDEEEDELQLILEGRDIPIDRYDSDRSDEDEEVVVPTNTSIKKKRSLDESQQTIANYKKKKSVQQEQQFVNEEADVGYGMVEAQTDQKDETQTGLKKKVRRIASQPRVILNADRLMSARGLALLPEICADIKFRGKGHELEDLNTVMFRLSHWSHRLFPSLTFDDFIDKCEQLGHKKAIKNFVTKIRYDMPLNIAPGQVIDDDEEDNDKNDRLDDQDLDDADFDSIIGKNYSSLCEKRPELDSDNEDNRQNEDYVNEKVFGDKEVVNNENKFEDPIEEVSPESIVSHKDSITRTETVITDIKQIVDEDEEMDEEELLKEINSDD